MKRAKRKRLPPTGLNHGDATAIAKETGRSVQHIIEVARGRRTAAKSLQAVIDRYRKAANSSATVAA